MRDFFLRIQWFQLNLLNLPFLGCAVPNAAYHFTIRFTLLLPFGVLVIMAAAWVASCWYCRRLDRPGVEVAKVLDRLTDNVIHSYMFILFLFYPVISSKVHGTLRHDC
jgi:hypothetical protein